MSWQRSYWFHAPLTKQLKWESVGHGEVTINNARTIHMTSPIRMKNDHKSNVSAVLIVLSDGCLMLLKPSPIQK